MTDFYSINLSKTPAPNVIEEIDFEDIFKEMLEDFQSKKPEYSAILLSDPVIKILEVCAYREMLLRQRVNDAAKACYLPTASGTDLDNLAALFNIERVPESYDAVKNIQISAETDEQLRRRVLLALESITTAGSKGAYLFHALNTTYDVIDENSGDVEIVKVLDANVFSPEAESDNSGSGLVEVVVLANNSNYQIKLQDEVLKTLNREDIRPLTDKVEVIDAIKSSFDISVNLYLENGAVQEDVKNKVIAAIKAYINKDCFGFGKTIPLSGIYATIHQVPEVEKASITSPVSDLSATWDEYYQLENINLTFE